jgi:hypothetical protein
MKKIQLLIVSLILIVSNTAFAEAALKYAESGNLMRWEKKNLTICLNDDVKKIPNIEVYFLQAIDAWSPVQAFPRMELGNSSCDIYVLYKDFICCGNIRPLAINVLTHYQTGQIIKATITINKYYQYKMGDASVDAGIYDLPGGIAHELGHAVGLEEDLEDRQSIMYDTNFLGKTYKRFIKRGDIAAISKVYF